MAKNKVPSWLKIFFGICVISFFHITTIQFMPDNFILKIVVGMIFWASIVIFMDWREWVTK